MVNPAWRGLRRKKTVGYPAPIRRSSDVSDVFAQKCLGYCGPTGGGQPNPPTMTPAWHDGAVKVLKWTAHHHLPVCQGGGSENV